MAPTCHIGTSGWHYPRTGGVLSIRTTCRRTPGSHGTRATSIAVEVNSSFYRLPTLAAVRGWRAATPGGFWIRAQGQPLHHPYEEAARAACEPARVSRPGARPGRSVRPAAVPAAAALAV
ncbi:MAG: DUF72 domain-containing protein [Desulfosudis oleivorans]|nr:DUF72 domain-containing protein [Desulfosudis oleivorans]